MGRGRLRVIVADLSDGMRSFEDRAAARLRREPPSPGAARADARGDHSLDAGRWRPATPGPVSAPAPEPALAAVLIAVVDRADGPTVILTERARSLRQHAGQIAFPGGRVDPEDATPQAAALREAEEEIGLEPSRVTPLGYLDAYLSGTGYLVVPTVARVAPGFSLALNPREVEHAFEVPLAFLMDPTRHELHARDWGGRVRSYHAIPFGRHYIWGVTAGIIRNMHERLFAP